MSLDLSEHGSATGAGSVKEREHAVAWQAEQVHGGVTRGIRAQETPTLTTQMKKWQTTPRVMNLYIWKTNEHVDQSKARKTDYVKAKPAAQSPTQLQTRHTSTHTNTPATYISLSTKGITLRSTTKRRRVVAPTTVIVIIIIAQGIDCNVYVRCVDPRSGFCRVATVHLDSSRSFPLLNLLFFTLFTTVPFPSAIWIFQLGYTCN